MDGAAYHYRAVVAIFLQRVEQGGCKAEVALHEFFLVLRAVDSSKVEDEVGFPTVAVELLGGGVDVVLEDFLDVAVSVQLLAIGFILGYKTVVFGFAFLDVIELGAKVFAYEAFGTGD